MERPVSGPRTTSFNPEAVAFSPICSSEPPQNVDIAPAASRTLPQATLDSDSTFAMAPMFNYSPFYDIGNARPLPRRNPLTQAPACLEDVMSQDVQALVRELEEHPDVQEIRAPQTPKPVAALSAEVARGSAASLPPFTFPPPLPQSQPDYTMVGIDELSSGLGLPTAKIDDAEDASTVTSYKSPTSQAHPGALYGKLIGWALNKPLTAKGLAELLQKQDTNTDSEIWTLPPMSPTKTPKTKTTSIESESPSTQETGSSSLRQIPAIFTSGADAYSKGPPLPRHHHQHHRSSTSTASYRQHTRVPSHRRYSRRSSRAKRVDQGPMPSAADIYPDDFHPTPPRGYEKQSMNRSQPEKPQIVIANPFNWPPPAQVYAPEPPPSLADMHAADIDVLALMNELPEPSLPTLAKLGSTHDLRASSGLDLPYDERALTPGQEDGSRYGIRFFGLAYGDQWKVAGIEEGQVFRVRPREHEGWGGWQWALSKGWTG